MTLQQQSIPYMIDLNIEVREHNAGPHGESVSMKIKGVDREDDGSLTIYVERV